MDKKQLLKLANFMEKVPSEKFNMSAFAITELDDCTTAKQMLKGCDTAACLAGWTVLMRGYCVTKDEYAKRKHRKMLSISERAAKILRLDVEEEEKLFYVSYWPPEFRQRFYSLPDTDTRLQIAIDLLRYLAQGGL
jgi:hypothetical protein